MAVGDSKTLPQEVAGNAHDEKDSALLAAILMEKSRLEPNGREHREVHEVSDQGIGATVSGPPTFEMPDNYLGYGGEGASVVNDRSELSASPRSRTSVMSHSQGHNGGYSDSLTMTPTEVGTPSASPISRKAVPASAGMMERTGQEASPIQDTDAVEREKIALEQRRMRIAAEREHLRRMRELDEEEMGIENRLSSLSGNTSPH